MSTNKIHNTLSPTETQKLGREFAKEILKKQPFAKAQGKQKAVILALRGDLGGGKTTFLQGVASGLGIKEKILSPTFVLMKRFKIKHKHFNIFYHLDCYRIKSAKEISELGFNEIISNPKNIIAIEWADKIKTILPKNTIWLDFEFKTKFKRKISIRYCN